MFGFIVRLSSSFELADRFSIVPRGSEKGSCITILFVKGMASSQELVWIVGDSYVFWLKWFVASTEVRFAGSLLESQNCQIALHGYRGGTVPSLAASPNLKC